MRAPHQASLVDGWDSCWGSEHRFSTTVADLAALWQRLSAERSADLRAYYAKHTKPDRLDSIVLTRLPMLHPEGLHPQRGLGPGDSSISGPTSGMDLPTTRLRRSTNPVERDA